MTVKLNLKLLTFSKLDYFFVYGQSRGLRVLKLNRGTKIFVKKLADQSHSQSSSLDSRYDRQQHY